jgi:hypothetical protein
MRVILATTKSKNFFQGFAAGKYSATAQDVSVKRLTRSNPTMAKKFDELR